MQKTKLIRLLKTFSKGEMKSFEKFVSSPYHNNGRNFKPLYRILKGYYPAFENKSLTEEKVFKRLYPAKKYDKKSSVTIRVLLSQMGALAEKFIVYEGFESGKLSYDFNKYLSRAYISYKLFDPALKAALVNSKMLDKDLKKEMYAERRLETNRLISDIFGVLTKPKEKFKHTSNNILYIYAHILDTFAFFHNEYRVYMRNNNLIYKGDDLVMHFIKTFDLKLFDMECDEDAYETKKLAMINFYYLKSFIDEGDNESILNAINIYVKIFDNLNRFKQYDIYTLLLNRCIGKSKYNPVFVKTGSDLTDFVWGKGVLSYEERYITPFNYLYVLHFKLSSLGNDQFRKFVSEYSEKIPPEFRDDIKNYSYACVYFKEKSFGKCLEHLSKYASLNLPTRKANKQKLKICCLYELSHFENVLSELDTFEHFLRNNTNVSEIVKTENFNFINGIKKLIRVKNSDMKKPCPEMKEILELTQNLQWGYWFKEKIEELAR